MMTTQALILIQLCNYHERWVCLSELCWTIILHVSLLWFAFVLVKNLFAITASVFLTLMLTESAW